MGLLPGAASSWRIIGFRPGQPEGSPLRNLARALLDESGQPSTPDAIGRMHAQFMREGPRALLNWCRGGGLPAATNLLLVVDQFEELFRYQDYSSREEAEAFVALLMESRQPLEASSPQMAALPIYITLTMRSEFLGACSLIHNLPEAITAGAFLTPRMTREQYREAIEGPADVCRIKVEERLVNRMLNDLAAFAPWDENEPELPDADARADPVEAQDQLMRLARRADQLPVLQHVLNRMWQRASDRSAVAPIKSDDQRAPAASAGESSEPAPIAGDDQHAQAAVELTLEDYESVGGVEHALNAHAEAVLAALVAKHGAAIERTTERMFRALVTGATPSEAVRRPTRLKELTEIAQNESGVRDIAEAFRADECNFLMPEPTVPLAPDTTLDISHESLIRQWTRLSKLVPAEAAAAQQWRRLNDRFRMGEPLRDRALENFVAWREETQPNAAWAGRYGTGDYDAAMAFLGKSERAEKHRRWSRNAIGAGVLVFLVLVAGVMTYLWQSVRAERNRALAAEISAREASIDVGQVATSAREKYSDIADRRLTNVDEALDWAPPAWSAYLHRQKTQALLKTGDFVAARKEIDLARKANPGYLPTLGTSSDLYLIAGDGEKAARDAALHLQTVTSNASSGENLILALAMQQKYDEAIEHLGTTLNDIRLPIDSTDSFVAPDVQTFTRGFDLSVLDTDVLLALRYIGAMLYAMKGDERFQAALDEADGSDRDHPYSRNAYLAALNWEWIILRGQEAHRVQSARQGGTETAAGELSDYGAYAIQGALWDRVARTRPAYRSYALSAYEKFRAAYRSHPQDRYKSLATWVDQELRKPLQVAPPEDTTVDRARALAQRAQELKAPSGTHSLNFASAFAQLSDAIELLTPKAGATPGRRQQDLLIDLLLRRADWRLEGSATEIDKGGAADDARAVIKLDPNVPEAYRVLAAAAFDDVTRRQNDEQALKLDPFNSEALSDLADLIQKDDPKAALELLKKRQRVATTWSSGYSLLAKLQTRVGDYAEALVNIDNAIASAPWQLNLLTQRQSIEQKMGNVDPATITLHLAQRLRYSAAYEARVGDDGFALKRYLLAFMTLSALPTQSADASFEMQTIIRDLSTFLTNNYGRADAQLFWRSLAQDPLLNSSQQKLAAQEASRLAR
jgi:conflict system STAND superfamily ATPase